MQPFETLQKSTIDIPANAEISIKFIGRTDGYDGHSLRAYSYFSSFMPDINNTVDSINSIQERYGDLRQRSKGPTFALTYGGTAYALEYQCGIPKEEANSIEREYHKLYTVSDNYVTEKLTEACETGYITVAFGLRVRTPVLQQVILNNAATPYAGSAEGRTAGNALGQSYGQLTNRAANDFMHRVASSNYRNDIKLIGMIHDAIYPIFRNTVGCAEFINNNLIHAMSWQELPEIQHDTVKLGAGLELYPDWSKPIKIPNNASKQEILDICKTFDS